MHAENPVVSSQSQTRTRRGQKLSLASSNLEGLSEAELRDRSKRETVPAGWYRPRRRGAVSLEEQEEIVDLYIKDAVPQKEVARRHRVTPNLVSVLVRESRTNPGKKRELKDKRKEAENNREAVKDTANSILEEGRSITSSCQVRELLLTEHNRIISARLVRQVLKEDL